MTSLTPSLPLSLYVHLPWCVRKCPYCDFNSHERSGGLPETLYVAALLSDLDRVLAQVPDRPLISIFFGGGTPSLFSGAAITAILQGIKQRIAMSPLSEVTLEANPGVAEQARFRAFREAGVNRLSIGVQSLRSDKLKALGRLHDRDQAIRAIEMADQAGFTNVNLDLMYGLPQQSIEEALSDIETALSFQPTHLSWYQLTIEPNTFFYHHPPLLPTEDQIEEIQAQGQAKLVAAGFQQYEVSAYARPGFFCTHNYHYWTFGDYLGIGAGAHSKVTDQETGMIRRFVQVKHPRDYLNLHQRRLPTERILSSHERVFEFMLNALRLTNGIPTALFEERTGLSWRSIELLLEQARQKGLLIYDEVFLCPTALGKRFLNDLIALFLPPC